MRLTSLPRGRHTLPEHLDILESLHGLDLPDPALSDMLAAFGAGLLLAAVIIAVIQLFARRRASDATTLQGRLTAAEQLPMAERQTALAHLLRDLTEGGDKPDWLERARTQHNLRAEAAEMIGPALYQPDPPTDLSALDAELRRIVARAVSRQ